MASYRVVIKPSAAKELDRLPKKELKRISERIRGLAEDPRPAGCEKLSGQDRYRLRQGVYRIIYEIEDVVRIVRVVKVAHRKDVYRSR